MIDFETVPGDVPTSGLAINDQFLASHGVSFSLEDGSDPVLAEVGAPATAFRGPPNSQGDDNPAPGVDAGAFFLTDDGIIGGPSPSPLIVTYAMPTAAASGEILDVDGEELFELEARDALDAVLETVVIAAGDPDTGDGQATPWVFQRPQEDVFSIRIAGSAGAGRGFGLAFDNFNATGICADTPREGCIPAGKAKLAIKEKKPGKEKLKLKLAKFVDLTSQGDFGNPVEGNTRVDVCLYDDQDQLAGGLSVLRAGDVCGRKQKPCWKAKKDRGWVYKDPDSASGGVKKIAAAGGPPGKGKLKLKAGNKAKKGQTALPTGLTDALQGATSSTVQVVASDSACFEGTLDTVKKADPALFKAKGR